jgi:methylmalonyl-CoA mutase, N-terminal domain
MKKAKGEGAGGDDAGLPSRDRKEWERRTLTPALAGHGERDAAFTTVSGMPVERLFGPEDLGPGWRPEERLGFPGEYPFPRGIHPTM